MTCATLTDAIPVSVSQIDLEPHEKMLIVLDKNCSPMYRVKNCCGKICAPFGIRTDFVIQNNNDKYTYFALPDTTLSELFLTKQLDTYACVKRKTENGDITPPPSLDNNNDGYCYNEHDHDDCSHTRFNSGLCCGDRGDAKWIETAAATATATEPFAVAAAVAAASAAAAAAAVVYVAATENQFVAAAAATAAAAAAAATHDDDLVTTATTTTTPCQQQ